MMRLYFQFWSINPFIKEGKMKKIIVLNKGVKSVGPAAACCYVAFIPYRR
jgi:hypothetical protein